MSRTVPTRQYSSALALAALVVFAAEQSARASSGTADPTFRLTGKPGGLTSEQVARRASATSFAVEQKRREVDAAAASLQRALYDLAPRLSGTASYFRLSKVESSSLGTVVVAPGAVPGPLRAGEPLAATAIQFNSLQDATAFSASLTLPLTDYVFRLVQSKQGAEAQLQSSRFLLEATLRKAAYDARALYYDWVRTELEAAAAEQNLQLGQEHLARLRALADAESVAPADVARVEATVASSERVLVQARNLAALQRERVGISMHDGPRRDYQIGEDLSTAPPDRTDLDDIAQLTLTAEQQRLELKAAQQQARAFGKQADAASSRVLPRLDGMAQGTFANPNQRYFPPKDEFKTSWQVGLVLSFSPNDTLTARTDIAAARAQSAATLSQRGQLLDAVRAEVAEAVLAHRTAQAGLRSSARRLAAAETSYRSRRERFRVGQATTVELTEAQTEFFNAQLEAVQAQVAIRLARARIAYVVGR